MKIFKILVLINFLMFWSCKKDKPEEIKNNSTFQSENSSAIDKAFNTQIKFHSALNKKKTIPNDKINETLELMSGTCDNDNIYSYVKTDKNKNFIFTSQDYGTNYMISAEFYTLLDQSSGETYIESVNFSIINYKPNGVFLGIQDVKISSDSDVLGIQFAIRKDAKKMFTWNNLDQKHVVKKGKCLNVSKYLVPYKYESIVKGNTTVVQDEIGYLPFAPRNPDYVHNENSLWHVLPQDDTFFDFEFFYRDGIHISPKINPYMIQKQGPGFRCRDAHHIMLEP